MAKRKGSSRKERTSSDIGKYLTEIRLSQGKTQQEIADRIGRDKSCICKIERGQRTQKSLRGEILYEIAIAYEISIEDIQRRAYWPQSILSLDITDEEMQELIRHLKRMRERKRQQGPQPKEQGSY